MVKVYVPKSEKIGLNKIDQNEINTLKVESRERKLISKYFNSDEVGIIYNVPTNRIVELHSITISVCGIVAGTIIAHIWVDYLLAGSLDNRLICGFQLRSLTSDSHTIYFNPSLNLNKFKYIYANIANGAGLIGSYVIVLDEIEKN